MRRSKLGQYFAAIADYDIAIRLNPDYAEAYYNRGLAKYDLGQHFAAIADYDIAIRLNPDDADAYNNRGVAKRSSVNTSPPSQIMISPSASILMMPDAYYNRGIAKSKLGQHFAAIADYDIAIRLNPDYAYAYYTRGLAKALLNRTWEAKQDVRTALRLAKQAGDTSLVTDIEKVLHLLE